MMIMLLDNIESVPQLAHPTILLLTAVVSRFAVPFLMNIELMIDFERLIL